MLFDPTVRHVSDEMSRDVVWLQPRDSVLEALKMIERERVTALPVVDEHERCVGIVSATDLIKVARQIAELLTRIAESGDDQNSALIKQLTENGFAKGRVGELMRTPAKNVAPDASLVKAGRKMLRHRIHHLPVTDEQNELLGIISTMDLLAAFVVTASETAAQSKTSC